MEEVPSGPHLASCKNCDTDRANNLLDVSLMWAWYKNQPTHIAPATVLDLLPLGHEAEINEISALN